MRTYQLNLVFASPDGSGHSLRLATIEAETDREAVAEALLHTRAVAGDALFSATLATGEGRAVWSLRGAEAPADP